MSGKRDVTFMNVTEELIEHLYDYAIGKEKLDILQGVISEINEKVNILCNIPCLEREQIFFTRTKFLFDDVFMGKEENCKLNVLKEIKKIEDFCTTVEVAPHSGILRKSDPVEFYDRGNIPLFYLDNNAFIGVKKLLDKYKTLRDNPIQNNQIVYGPAHLEELANSNRNNILELTTEIYSDLNILNEITNTVEFLPSECKGIVLVKENSMNGYVRVINEYDKTIIAEIEEMIFLIFRATIRKEKGLHLRGDNIKNVLESNVAQKFLSKSFEWYGEYSENKEKFWNKHKEDYDFLFQTMEELSKLIDVLDNNPEPTRLYRSHLHDVTHLIYASHADYFITDDKRLRKKFEEVKRFFGFNTLLLSFKESPFYIGDI